MSSADIKIDLFRKLDQLNEQSLKEAYGLLLNYINSKTDFDEWGELTQEQKDAIINSGNRLDNGEGRSHTEVITYLRSKYLDN